ncbi:MAG: hypothetical protein JXA21_20775 [Anaerolineae bacterium]|nr:hypothetical protein [Anaerolineae bacterium]
MPPESNRGFVAKLMLTPDYRWFAGFDIRDPETANGVRNGVIADCSVYLQPDVVHNVTGKKYPWALRHVLLTNNPLVSGLSGFGEKPLDAADRDAVIVEVYQPNPIRVIQAGGTPMPDQIQLTEQELAQFKAFKDLNLSADAVTAMQQRDQAVRRKARDLEIGAILNALQGKGQHAGVTQIEGYVHYPVVAVAVEKALKELPQSLALNADENGATGVDAVILSLVNAIPREGRVSLQQPQGRKDAPPAVAGDDGDVTAKKHSAETLDGLAEIL